MKILFLNNDGGGFADHIEIAPGTTVVDLFGQRLPHSRPEDYLIRVNRQPAAANHVLQEGDRVSLTPTKIEGAFCSTKCPRSTLIDGWSSHSAWRDENPQLQAFA